VLGPVSKGSPPQPPGVGYRERPSKGSIPMPTLVVVSAVLSVLCKYLFAYLKYRAYLDTLRYLSDWYGLPAVTLAAEFYPTRSILGCAQHRSGETSKAAELPPARR
jgi:hypothetical protein